ncbi:UvrD-helicase domain-containing protein [Streptacidiphilus sp. PAMC 29251]
MTYPPTAEQQEVIDDFLLGHDLKIQAGAGAGKTSTLKFTAAAAGSSRGLYIAYNRPIKEEAARSFPRTVRCVTSHGLAYATIGIRYRHRINSSRLPARTVAQILGVARPLAVSETLAPLAPWQVVIHATAAAKRFCHSADRAIGAKHIPRIKGYDAEENERLAEAVAPLAQMVWEDWTDPEGRLKYDQDAYLKQYLLCSPKVEEDYVMLDEAQDANPALTGFMLDQHHVQRIAVGDSCQQLYAWRGAEDALGVLPGSELTLSQSFRFGNAIAEEANVWLGVLDAPLRLTGYDRIDSRLGQLHRPDAILCRTNAGCMGAAMALMATGTKVAVVGGGKAMKDMAYAAVDLKAGRATSHPELMAFSTWDQVVDYAENDPDGADLKPLVDLIEEHGPTRLIQAAGALSDERNAQVTVSTAHKSKGREWATVKIGSDFHAPKRNPETGELRITRALAMLAYVAVTRAREVLDCEALSWVDNLDGTV